MQSTFSGPASRSGPASGDLVSLAKQRDAAAWSEIYSQNYVPVYCYIFGRTGRKELAEDLAAQVFLEALQSISSYRERGMPLLAWLYGISRNLIRNGARRSKRNGEADAVVLDDAAEALTADAWHDVVDVESLDLVTAIGRLSKDQREVLVLRFFVGLSAKEAASVMRKTEQAVYSLQVRGIAALKRAVAFEAPRREPAV